MFPIRAISRAAVLAGAGALTAMPLVLLAAPQASSAPAYDSRGYVDSTARCTGDSTVVVFGSTASSRVAICQDGDGRYQYRGVRVRDGARLIVPASKSSDGAFTATTDGVEYRVTSKALVISVGEKVIRDEAMLDFHRAGSDGTGSGSAETTSTQTPSTQTPTTQPSAPTTSSAPSTPLPPPLPAEVGGGEDGG